MLALRPLFRTPLYLQTGRGAAFELQRRGKKKKAKAAPARGATDESDGLDLTPYRTDMQKTLDSATHDIGNIRVSEANPALLDGIRVDAYGATATLSKVAKVSVRNSRTLSISVFDNALSSAVEKAIRGAGLNLNPVSENDGRLTVPVPKPSKDTKEALRKLALSGAENAKIAARNIRRSAMTTLKGKKSELGTNEFRQYEKDVQAMTDDCVSAIDKLADAKVKAIAAG